MSNPPGDESKRKKEETGAFANYLKIYTFARPFDWFLFALCVVSSVGAGAAMPIMFVIFGRVVNNVSAQSNPETAVDPHSFTRGISRNALYIVYIGIVKMALSYISLYTVRVSGLRISAAIRLAYLEALFKQRLGYIDTLSVGKVSHRITTSANAIQLGVSQQMAMLLQSLAQIIGFFVVAFAHDAILTLVAISVIPCIILGYGLPIPFLFKYMKQIEAAKEAASALAHEVFASIRIVTAFGAESKLARRHKKLTLEAKRHDMKTVPLMGIMMSPTMFCMFSCCALTFWYGIRQISRGHTKNVGTIVVVYFCVMVATTAVGRIAGPMYLISSAGTAASQIFETLKIKAPDMSGLKDPDVSAEEDIILEDVCFAYPSRQDVMVLNHLNVTFEAGKTTAIVGPSGSGKSTIVALLQRWYDLGIDDDDVSLEHETAAKGEVSEGKTDIEKFHTSGVVRLGNTNMKRIDANWWRNQIGLVQQDPFLFNDTLYNNVAFGLCGTDQWNESEERKLELVIEACKEAHAHDFICSFPQGYQTLVGESGIKLSGGQRQRIAIARSIIKKPTLLILDEATSALDVHSEAVVQKTLDQVSRARTTIVIAHRLSTIKRADKIVVLREGAAVEEGTHSDLLEKEDGVYSQLVRAQVIVLGTEDAEEKEKTQTEELQRIASKKADQDAADQAKDSAETNVSADKQRYFRSLVRVMLDHFRKYWLLFTSLLVVAGITGAVQPLMAWLFAQLIGVFSLSGSRFVDRGNFWALMYFILALVTLVSYFLLGCLAVAAAVVVAADSMTEYFENLIWKPISFFDEEGTSPGTLTSQVSNDPARLRQLLGVEMALSLSAVYTLLGSVIISLVFSWRLGIVGLFALVPVIMVAGVARVRIEMQFTRLNAEVFKESSQFATEAVGAFRTVLSLTLEDLIVKRYRGLLKSQTGKVLRQAIFFSVIFAVSDSVDMFSSALIFWYGARLLASGQMDVISYFVVYSAIVQGTQIAGIFFSHSPNVAEASAAANRILKARSSVLKDVSSGTSPDDEGGAIGLSFDDVHFTYPTRKERVLSGLTLDIKPGQFAALVGPSGCGKSTVVNLIERFYDLDSGTISSDGTDISTLNLGSHRRRLALVSQEPTLYEGTIRENVALSIEEEDDDAADASGLDTRIQAACTEAQIHEFIVSLPDGYATRLGPKGISLSGGQKQRVALARALVRRPRLLLLDEATSSLDSESEKLVQRAIERAAGKGGVTILAVAHRLATIQNADVIFVLDKGGKLVEKGSHAELIARKGVYFEMCQAQALDR